MFDNKQTQEANQPAGAATTAAPGKQTQVEKRPPTLIKRIAITMGSATRAIPTTRRPRPVPSPTTRRLETRGTDASTTSSTSFSYGR